MSAITERIFSYIPGQQTFTGKYEEIFNTTGPFIIMDVYEKYHDKSNIYLIPAKYVSPYSKTEVGKIIRGEVSEELEQKLKDAYSIHYFFNGWL